MRWFGFVFCAFLTLTACGQNKGNVEMSETPKAETPVFANHSMNLIVFPVTDMDEAKAFYTAAFGWSFIDYGPEYAAITGAGLDGGLDASNTRKPSATGPLVVIYADDLDASFESVKKAGGVITMEINSFPGGRGFHFTDPSGNELGMATSVAEK